MGQPFPRKKIVSRCVSIVLTDFVSNYIDNLTAKMGAFSMARTQGQFAEHSRDPF